MAISAVRVASTPVGLSVLLTLLFIFPIHYSYTLVLGSKRVALPSRTMHRLWSQLSLSASYRCGGSSLTISNEKSKPRGALKLSQNLYLG